MARKSSRAMWTAKLAGSGAKATTDESPLAGWGKRIPCDGVVLGVDPSLRGTGIAVIEFRPQKQPQLLFSETIRVSPKIIQTICLGRIAEKITQALDAWPITEAAIEETIYVQNFQTAQVLGAARGACIAPIAMRHLPITEYAPLRIKQSVVGFGRASKEQVAALVKSQLGLEKELPSDESDASAVAICHAMSLRE